MFTQAQLNEIQFAAKRTKNQGELAVYKYLLDANKEDATRFSLMQWNIIKYCAEECKRQHSGEMSVYDMVNAWNFASLLKENQIGLQNTDIDKEFIEEVGKLVEPIDNKKGFRTIAIGVTDGYGGWIEKANWERVPQLLTNLIESYYEGNLLITEGWYTGQPEKAKTAEDWFYYEYENIHPFVDGNGRSGKILYNYLNGTLENPIMPPNFWDSNNP